MHHMVFILLLVHLEKPGILNVSYAAGRRNATLSWTYPFDGNQPITYYTISYSENVKNVTRFKQIATRGKRPPYWNTTISYEIAGLLPFSIYAFAVTATNAEGNSTASARTFVQTKQDSKYGSYVRFVRGLDSVLCY